MIEGNSIPTLHTERDRHMCIRILPGISHFKLDQNAIFYGFIFIFHYFWHKGSMISFINIHWALELNIHNLDAKLNSTSNPHVPFPTKLSFEVHGLLWLGGTMDNEFSVSDTDTSSLFTVKHDSIIWNEIVTNSPWWQDRFYCYTPRNPAWLSVDFLGRWSCHPQLWLLLLLPRLLLCPFYFYLSLLTPPCP